MESIFSQSQTERLARAQIPSGPIDLSDIPNEMLRTTTPLLPEVSELQAVRHYTRLSQQNYSIDTQFYPLGSCTMKYNPRGVQHMAHLPGFLNRHPLSNVAESQGYLACLYDIQEYLKEITGMEAVSLTPMAGSQGEFAGVAMIRAYHQARGDHQRSEILIPDGAHGTNPASAAMCGYEVVEVPTLPNGNLDLETFKLKVGPRTAGMMMTNPSTLGVFESDIVNISKIIHQAGGLMYYDGANLNAIVGKVRPGDMGFDVVHLNLHKTFATPHGGGGPGAGPVTANARLAPYLPIPFVKKQGNHFMWTTKKDHPQSIGRLSTFMGNAGVLLRAYAYARLLGCQGLPRVAEFATLNANYLQARLAKAGFELAYPNRRASHEFIITFKNVKKQLNVSALDIAKRLLDYGFHAPTMYFPLIVPECFLIEPTETEAKQDLDAFVNALIAILQEAEKDPEKLRTAPHHLPVRRLDEVKAARDLSLVWS